MPNLRTHCSIGKTVPNPRRIVDNPQRNNTYRAIVRRACMWEAVHTQLYSTRRAAGQQQGRSLSTFHGWTTAPQLPATPHAAASHASPAFQCRWRWRRRACENGPVTAWPLPRYSSPRLSQNSYGVCWTSTSHSSFDRHKTRLTTYTKTKWQRLGINFHRA
jgi:hypothetical protein